MSSPSFDEAVCLLMMDVMIKAQMDVAKSRSTGHRSFASIRTGLVNQVSWDWSCNSLFEW